MHGSGEKGNSETNPDALDKVLKNGPPKMIEKDQWSPTYPMIVLSPQSTGWWDPKEIHQYIKYVSAEYRINPERIYLTGLSMGGYGTFSYVQLYGDSSLVAAVPICGGGNPNQAESFKNMPVWAFHGDADNTVNINNSIAMYDAINASEIEATYPAKLTVYPGVGHNSWTRTYDGSGMTTEREDYDSFDRSIYDWFFEYSKPDMVP